MREEARSFVAHECNAYGSAARQHNDLLGRLHEANARHAGLEQELQEYAHHLAIMQQCAMEQINASEKKKVIMKYELDRMKHEMEDVRRERSARSDTGSARSGSGLSSRRLSV